MGNSESNPVRNLDKRTARREYKDYFLNGIRQYNQSVLIDNDVANSTNNSSNKLISSPNDHATGIHGSVSSRNRTASIKVCARKRPFFTKEEKAGEFDVITCVDSKRIVTHDCRMEADMKSMYVNRNLFNFDSVFNDKCSNIDVYNETTSPLVNDTMLNASYNTVMVYGQTGSGKTFTMSSIYENTAEEIFRIIGDSPRPVTVSISFIEIAGESVHDILNNFMPCQLLSAVDGSVHAFPTVEPVVSSKEQLLAIVAHGIRVRSTAETGVHDSSSRSHAVLRIFFNGDSSGLNREGCLTLVDLAGTEHKIDSMYHSKDRRNETSKINSSLSALKFCLNAISTYNSSSNINASAADASSDNGRSGNDIAHHFRKSKLTMVLKSSLLEPTANTVIIATVSPASKDTDHSLNTLRHATLMGGCSLANDDFSGKKGAEATEKRFITGGVVTKHRLGQLNISEITRRNQQQRKKKGEAAELKTDNGNVLKGEAAVDLTEKEKDAVRMQKEIKSFKMMETAHRNILAESRRLLGQNELQIRRQRRPKPQVQKAVAPATSEIQDSITVKEDIIITNFDIKGFNKVYSFCMNSVATSGESRDLAIRQIISLLKGKGFPKNKIEKLFHISKQNEANGFLIPLVSELKDARDDSACSGGSSDCGTPRIRVSFKEFTEKNISSPAPKPSDKENINREVFTAIEAVSDKDLNLFNRMYSSIFHNLEESSPEILTRQLISLMKLKGFSKKKIEQLFTMYKGPIPLLHAEGDTANNIVVNNHNNSGSILSSSSNHNSSAISQYENEIALKNQRRQSAREKALEKEAERINSVKERMQRKERKGNIIGINPATSYGGDVNDANSYDSNHNFVSNEIELNILLDELQNTTKISTASYTSKDKNAASAAKVFALKKKISMLRANIIKAQKYSKTNGGSNGYGDSDKDASPPPPNKFAARYENLTSSQSEHTLSTLPPPLASSHRVIDYSKSNGTINLDPHGPPSFTNRNKGRNSIGAAGAPFGNDYSYYDERINNMT